MSFRHVAMLARAPFSAASLAAKQLPKAFSSRFHSTLNSRRCRTSLARSCKSLETQRNPSVGPSLLYV